MVGMAVCFSSCPKAFDRKVIYMFSMYCRIFLTYFFMILAMALGVVSSPALAALQRVGIAAAVNPATNGTPPGGAGRVIVIGSKMLQDERIVTSDEGRTQLLFLDGSALTIGPNSELVLDEFVYDPNAKKGKLAFSATKGLFRFVGGKISKTTPVTFTTPTAVIGIRGGIGIITVREVQKQAAAGTGLAAGDEGGQPQLAATSGTLRLAQAAPAARVVTTAQLAFGQMTVQSGGVTRAINIPGFQVVAVNPGQAPSQPTRAEAPGAGLSGLEGAGGGTTGGATKAPRNEDVADTQISVLGSNLKPKAIVSAPPVVKPVALPPPGNDLVGDREKLTTIDNTLSNAQQDKVLDNTAGTDGGVRLTGTRSEFIYGGRFLSQTPFTGFNFADGRTTRVGLRNENGGGARLSAGILAFGSTVDGTDFRLPIKSGEFTFGSDQGKTRFGAASGTAYVSPDLTFFYLNLREAEHSNNPSSVFAGVPFPGTFPTTGFRAHDLFTGFPGLSKVPMLPLNYGGNILGGPRPRLFSAYSPNLTTFPDDGRAVAIYGSIALEGVGPSQRSAQVVYMGTYFGDSASSNKIILSGYSRGSVRLNAGSRPIRVDGAGGATSRDNLGNSFFGSSGPDHFVISSDYTTGGTTTLLDAAGFVQTLETTATPTLSFFQENYTRPAPIPTGLGAVRSSRTLNGYISGIVTAKTGTSTFPVYIARTLSSNPDNFKIVTNAATNRLYATVKTEDALTSQSSLVIPLGNPSGVSRARQAFIDDNTFGARESSQSTPTVGGSAGQGRIALVTSAFTQLAPGLTSGIRFCTCNHTKWGFISGDVRADASIDRHRFHLVPWVAGVVSGPAATSGLTGTATYTGHVVANIENGGSQYVAFGNYSQSWNFSSRTGTATISDLDRATYSGTISGVSGSSGSQFHGSISGAGRSGSLQGSFMRNTSSLVGEIASQFQVTGGTYTAAGVGLAARP